MKPLITTSEALKELATGVSLTTVSTSSALFRWEGRRYEYLLTQNTKIDEQRIFLLRDDFPADQVVPPQVDSDRRAVLSRMASFSERARAAGTLTLPHAWHQYKHNNLIAFSAVPGFSSSATRWITEVLTGSRSDVVFWEATDNKVTLQEFEMKKPAFRVDEEEWRSAFKAAERNFREKAGPAPSDVEIALPGLDQTASKGWAYDEWMRLISDDQKAFVLAPTDKSIRLRGPAGSGKTLTLMLKAVHELQEAQKHGEKVRILIVTHSWSLASEISDSKDALGLGALADIDVFPLLEIATSISSSYDKNDSFTLIGTDSFSGKLAQISEILEVLESFIEGDWVTFKSGVSLSLRNRFDSADPEERKALAWDLLIEFGSVIGAAAIFPGAGSASRYKALERASWMLPLASEADLRVVFELYSRYMESLDSRGLLTSDQVLADFLADLQKHSWRRARRTEGYDLIFVDEFHLFNPLERQVLHHLSRDVGVYPRIFMALDPRQSPSEAFIGLASEETKSSASTDATDDLGEVTNLELTRVHRYTPQILELVKHIHLEFPTLDLGAGWNIDFSAIESAHEDGPKPQLIRSASRAAEEIDIARAVQDCYQTGRMALAVVDTRQWERFNKLAALLDKSKKFHVSTIAGRNDIEGLGYRKRGIVVGLAEYLAGLQFDTVLVAGIPDLSPSSRTSTELTRLLSLLYLGVSRAEGDVRIFVNDDDGGIPEVLQRATEKSFVSLQQGSLV